MMTNEQNEAGACILYLCHLAGGVCRKPHMCPNLTGRIHVGFADALPRAGEKSASLGNCPRMCGDLLECAVLGAPYDAIP
jgi:hypothetical protein